ncbi:MAG: hypothetical protein COB12_03600 [Flavobacterium sp.]|nr:MAG: hypothetical protein COB12_03600 [Flavobacterium sp.]
MKNILLLIFFSFFSSVSFGQSGALYNDWYLTSYMIDGESFSVSDINPNISPSLLINLDLEISGVGACNDFNGNFSYDDVNDLLIVNNFSTNQNPCDSQEQTDFETDYFNFLSENTTLSYTILFGSNGEYLDLTLNPGTIFYYQDYPILSINNNDFSKVYIYPNPTINNLYISADNNTIDRVLVYSITGKQILKQTNIQNNTIDVSTLSEGVYFIEIYSEGTKIVRKFIKN